MEYTSRVPLPSSREVNKLNRAFPIYASTLFSLLLLAVSPYASAQASVPNAGVGAVQPSAEPSIPSGAGRRVTIDVSVADSKELPIPGLTQKDFTLFNDKKPVQILSFQELGTEQTPARPDRVVIIVDAINLEFQYVSYARLQLEQFLRSNEGHLTQPTSIVFVTDDGVVDLAPATADGNALLTAFDKYQNGLRAIGRGGFYAAFDRFSMSVGNFIRIIDSASAQPGRKLLIWIGPGWPMLSGPNVMAPPPATERKIFQSIVHLSTEMRQDQVTLDSVSAGMPNANTYYYESFLKGVKSPNEANIGNLSEKVIAVQSGGVVIPPDFNLQGNIGKCIDMSSVVYRLSFDAPPADKPDQFHTLAIKIDRRGLKTYTNTGYYDQP
jgi:VWFA-related protein